MHRMVPLAVLVALLTMPAGAFAQPRQPAEGSVAVGGAVGAFLPTEDALNNSLYLEGQFQFQFSPRVGVRFGVGWTDSEFDREDEDSLSQVRIGADLLYNWERGAWHPYVGAGLGAHLLQEKDNGRDIGDGESGIGGSVLGGVEYFFTRDTVISGEARYQFVQDIRGLSPSGLLLAAGVKKYF
jgi:hypothetical protein